MTNEEKRKVIAYRKQGMGYKKIANIIGVTESAVKGFCKRQTFVENDVTSEIVCRSCGVSVEQIPGRKEKKFCSDRCRMKWWNSHMELVNRKANYEFTCPNCKKHFVCYGNKNRKYCCHDCYLEDRYGRK